MPCPSSGKRRYSTGWFRARSCSTIWSDSSCGTLGSFAPWITISGARIRSTAWIGESFRAAHVKAYAPPVGADGGPFTLSDAYAKDARAVANARIALAGVRLANLLNTELE